jgi:sugar (pentulose or hexulose) kinase
MLAAIGVGACPDYPKAAARMTSEGERFEPRAEAAAAYDSLFAVYESLYPALVTTYRLAAEAQGPGPVPRPSLQPDA